MATIKVSALTALTTPDGAEELLINDGGTSKKITIANAIIAGTGITKSGATISASPVALTTIQTASSESAQLALTAEEGDVVVRSDESKTYMHNGGSAGSMSDYTLMATPTDSVTSVVGQTGVVSTAQIKTALENGIDSVHYVDGSIDTAHIGDDQVTADKLANSINSAIAANTAKTGITSGQTSAIVANTAKVGITTGQANAITANTAKTGITSGQASAITANTAKVTNATHTGDVTGDTALTIGASKVITSMILDDNVTADKLANSINTDIATGVTANTTANAALPKAGGTMTGNLVMGTNLVDGIDISARDAVLTSTTTTAGAALPKAGGTLTGTVTVGTNAVGTMTTDNDGSFAMSASNNFKCTPAGNFALTFTAIVAQSGNILFINSGGHTISAHANTKVDATLLATISTAGTYLLAYFSDGTNVYMTNSAAYT